MFEDEAPATRGEVGALILQIESRRRKELTKELLQVRRDHCSSKGDARDLYQTNLAELRDEFYRLNNRPFPLPDCGDFSATIQ